jgi:hypothetical protein
MQLSSLASLASCAHCDATMQFDLAERMDKAEGSAPVAEAADARVMPMFAGDEAAGYRTRWEAVQTDRLLSL